MEKIENNGRLLAIIWRDSDWTPGLNFPTPDDLFIQAGGWQYPAGKSLAPHRHKKYSRDVQQTQESVYVKRGKMRVDLYDESNKLLRQFDLEQGDFAVLADCGHGYEILQDDTQILEIKNGPFVDVETDKEMI